MKRISISVIGLGKLGASTAAVFASKGYNVIGVDINPETIEMINNGKSPVFEPNLEELIKQNNNRIFATKDYNYAVMNSDISFIIVPTPSEKSGKFSTKYVETASTEIAKILKKKEKFHVITVTSTVLPGDMETIIKPLIENMSGKKCGLGFGLCYNPDFIAIGSVLHDLKNPDMVLIGESDTKSGEIVENIHMTICDNNPKIFRMNFYNAELAKIALNSFITRKITFANTLADICEKMPGGDAEIITKAIGSDKRVGEKYLKGALSFGGPCFPRDNRAFGYSAEKFGCNDEIAKITDKTNEFYRSKRIPDKIVELLNGDIENKVAILGLTYKPDTNITEESASIYIIKSLLKKGIFVNIYDPEGMDNAKKSIDIDKDKKLYFSNSIEDCLKGTSLCFIGTPWNQFKNLDEKIFSVNMKKPLILDAWGVLNFKDDANIKYYRIGRG